MGRREAARDELEAGGAGRTPNCGPSKSGSTGQGGSRISREALEHIFSELIGNAVRFCNSDVCEIRIAAETRDQEVRITVEDNGSGIPEEERERVFDLFYRLHGERFGGAGMGLPLLKMIVEVNGGRIWATSTPDGGAGFHFTFPQNRKSE